MVLYSPVGITDNCEYALGEDFKNIDRCKEYFTKLEARDYRFLVKFIEVSDEEHDKYEVKYLKEFTPSKVYVDMDGVLVDFEGGVIDQLGMELRKQGTYDPAYDDKLFEAIKNTPNFYLNLEPIKGSIKMINKIIDKMGIDNVEILTGIPKPSRGIVEAEDNKREWVKKYINDKIKVNAVLRKDKPNFATDNTCVLIDDYIANVKDWRKAGGTGIQFKTGLSTFNGLLRDLNII